MRAGTRRSRSGGSGAHGAASPAGFRGPITRHPILRRRAISAKVFVGNLSFQTTRDQLTALFSAAGSVVDAYLPTDRETGRPRGFAFVEFSSEAEAAAAIEQFNGREVDGRAIRVDVAGDRPRGGDGARPFRPSGPPFGGGGAPRNQPPFRRKGSRRGLRRRKRSL